MKRKKLFVFLYSLIFTILQYMGKRTAGKISSMGKVGLFYYLMVSTFFVYLIVYFIFSYLDNNKILNKKEINNRYIKIFNDNPFLVSFFIILIFWLPVIIIKYPGNLAYDGDGQLLEFFGYSNLINHHPVLHTLLFGICVEIGKRICSYNVGIFIFTLLQSFAFIAVFSYTIKFLKEINIDIKYRTMLLTIYSLFIIFPISVTVNTKDILYTAFAILYTIIFFKFSDINNKDISKSIIISSIIVMVLFSIFRKEGIYIVLFSFPILFFLNKSCIKKFLIMFIILILIYSFYMIMLRLLNIPEGSIKEPLAICFQQTARYIKDNKDEITEEEKNIISKVLRYSDLNKRLNTEESFLAKQYFNEKATKEDLLNYFGVYIKQFFKHPYSYYLGWVEKEYPYFYVEYKGTFFGDYKPEDVIVKDFDFHYIPGSEKIRAKLLNIQTQIGKNVIFMKSGFNFCIILFMYVYLIYRKKYKYSLTFIPVIYSMIICLFSPEYVYRLAMHYIYQVPMLFGIFISITNKDGKCNGGVDEKNISLHIK